MSPQKPRPDLLRIYLGNPYLLCRDISDGSGEVLCLDSGLDPQKGAGQH